MFPGNFFAKSYFDGDYFAPVTLIIVTEKEVRVRAGGPDFVQDIAQIMREDDEVIAVIIAAIQSDLI